MRECICVIGTGKIAFFCVQVIKLKGIPVTLFEVNDDKISGLEKLALKHDIKYLKFSEDVFSVYLNECDGKNILIISVLNRYIFKKNILGMSNVKIVNFHPGLLPQHAGMNPEAWAIFEGDDYAGITWHIVEERVDRGAVIVQKKVKIENTDTSVSLMLKLVKIGQEAFLEIIEDVISDTEKVYLQSKENGVFHFYKDIPNNGFIENNWPDDKKSVFLRAMNYGKLYNLGKIKTIINNKIYVANGYSIVEHNSINTISNKDYLIEGLHEDIILRGIELYE